MDILQSFTKSSDAFVLVLRGESRGAHGFHIRDHGAHSEQRSRRRVLARGNLVGHVWRGRVGTVLRLSGWGFLFNNEQYHYFQLLSEESMLFVIDWDERNTELFLSRRLHC